jgi:hypothetical protein
MLHIHEPPHGALLNHRDGIEENGTLYAQVRGTAPLACELSVNGVTAQRQGEGFSARVPLQQGRNELVANAKGFQGISEQRISVVWDRTKQKRYRFAIDDNCFFLRELHREQPANIFDNRYLAILKRLHDQYGTRFSLNTFYESPEKDFNLSMLSERWRTQFEDASPWLRMTWHAYAEFPARPYQYAAASKVLADLDLIHGEITRFAGAASWCPPNIAHFGELLPSVLPALAARGCCALSGYFRREEQRYAVSYGLDEWRCAQIESRGRLMDFASGIILSQIDMVLNSTPLAKIPPLLTAAMAAGPRAEFIDLLTHEQYFWPFYPNFIADHAERLDCALRMLSENGYQPVWIHEGILGK